MNGDKPDEDKGNEDPQQLGDHITEASQNGKKPEADK